MYATSVANGGEGYGSEAQQPVSSPPHPLFFDIRKRNLQQQMEELVGSSQWWASAGPTMQISHHMIDMIVCSLLPHEPFPGALQPVCG